MLKEFAETGGEGSPPHQRPAWPGGANLRKAGYTRVDEEMRLMINSPLSCIYAVTVHVKDSMFGAECKELTVRMGTKNPRGATAARAEELFGTVDEGVGNRLDLFIGVEEDPDIAAELVDPEIEMLGIRGWRIHPAR